MKFEVSQQFEAPASEVIERYCSLEMYEQLPDFDKISRPEIVDRTERSGLVQLRVRYRVIADLPAAALAIIDPERLTWIEDTTYDLAAMTATTRLLPDHYASKLEASASARFSDAPDGSRRTVSGNLRVHVLLVSGQVERAIVSGLQEHLSEEARLVAEFLG